MIIFCIFRNIYILHLVNILCVSYYQLINNFKIKDETLNGCDYYERIASKSGFGFDFRNR